MTFYDILIIGGIFCAFITSFILFFRAKNQCFGNRFLSIVIFSWSWYALMYMLMMTGTLRDFPHLWRLGSPLYYLIPCSCYLYVRLTLYRETHLRRQDVLHFIPATLHFLELIPFYLQPLEVKQRMVNDLVANINLSVQLGSGIIPAIWHYEVRPFIGLVYIVFMAAMLIHTWHRRNRMHLPEKPVMAWLLVFSAFVTVIYCGLAVQTVLSFQSLQTPSALLEHGQIAQYLMGGAFLGLSMYLFLKPDILYGIPLQQVADAGNLTAPESKGIIKAQRTITIDDALLKEYCSQLTAYMEQEQIFRQQGITISEIALQLKIPIYHFSYLVNKHYNMRFTDFVNNYRIAYIKKRMKQGDLKELTLEGLAKEAGFSSRSAFFAAFKKETGMSPTDYKGSLAASEHKTGVWHN